MENKQALLELAKSGDIKAFNELFSVFQKELKAFIYRMVADRSDSEDLAQDVFVKAFDKIKQFKEKSSFKTWVFSIATNTCIDFLRGKKRWETDSQDRSRKYAESNIDVEEVLINTNKYSSSGAYEMKEHIDFCFTCMSKTLPIEEQITLILKDVFDFKVNEISEIINKSPGIVKHLLHDSRKTMTIVFDHRCALVSKKGVCHQCSELNGYFNPKQNQQTELMKLALVQNKNDEDKEKLYKLRVELVKQIDPLNTEGSDLHDVFMQITRKVENEIDEINY